jgi:hypothetical protein
MECDGVKFIDLAQDTVQWLTCEHCSRPSCSIKIMEFLNQMRNY